MTNILQRRPDDRPPHNEDWGRGVALSVAAHAALVGALIWGVHWHSSSEPEGATAELWSAVPQAAAPAPTQAPPPPPPAPAPPPPPAPAPAPAPTPPVAETPKPPDIVTEQLEKKKKQREQEEARLAQQKAAEKAAEKAKADAAAKLAQQKADKARADAQAKADADKKAEQQKQLDSQKLAKLRQENLKRMLGQMDSPADATGTAARSSGPSASYMGRVVARLRPNLVLLDSMTGNPHVEVEIRCAPDGTIISRRVVKPSGSPDWDDAVLRAIDRTGTLPRDTDGRTPADMVIAWNLQDAK